MQGKYIYRFFCQFIFTVLATSSFAYEWYEFVKVNNQTGHLTGLGNIGMSILIYIILYIVVGRWLHAFKVGVERKANVMASQVLTLFTVDILEVFISMAITGQFRFAPHFIRIYGVLFFMQALVLSILVIPMIDLYRKIFPPLQLLEIYGEHRNLLGKKINMVPYKYHIADSIFCENMELINEKILMYDAVLINDLSAVYENIVLKKCFELDKRAYFVPKISDVLVKGSEQLNLFDTPLFLARNERINKFQLIIKRLCDVIISGVSLIIFCPLLLLIAIAIKIEDHGPIFYKQERCTIDCKHFMIYKFRSMIVDAEKDGRPHPAGEKDDRITKVGRIIRAIRVDELPQLINILKGDMSIVGPRPERYEHVEKYTNDIPEFVFRSKVKGGLTGMAQVYGKYNTTALDKLKLDLIYITNYSILLDLQIIFETLKILIHKDSTEGFTQEQAKEMEEACAENK